MTEMTAETTTEIDDDITLADGKRTLTNSQLLILGFIASYGVAGCSESKRDIAEALQVSLKTVDRASCACARRASSSRWPAMRKTACA